MTMNITPKKSLGQHWLHDLWVLEAMCDAGGVGRGDTVLEIGSGTGSLTEQLLERGADVFAIEKDERLLKDLVGKFRDSKFYLTEGDILTFDLTSLPANYKVVANIPYYLTSNLLRVLSQSPNPPAQMALLVQKEVAERVVSAPGSMSILSVSVQLYYEASLGQVVPARLFSPPPKVDSQILKLAWHTQPLFVGMDSKKFFRIVKAGFSNRRKTLLNSLSAGLHLNKQEAIKLLENAGINPQSRPQELSLNDWHKLYEHAA